MSEPVEVVGLDATGSVVARAALRHGEDPLLALAAYGLRASRVRGADRGAGHVLTFTVEVVPVPEDMPVAADTPRPGSAAGWQAGEVPPPRRDAGLVVAPGEVPVPVQRVAAYAVVTSGLGVLLTEFSDRTNAPGRWGLPGGGLDPDETPEEAVVREVWEETGQRVMRPLLVRVQSEHWVGRAPTGVLEDFHAVRVLYVATCPDPGEPVVQDVGGTTSAARWVPPADLADLPLTDTWRQVLEDLRHLWFSAAAAGR